jgi:hypothetical protein
MTPKAKAKIAAAQKKRWELVAKSAKNPDRYLKDNAIVFNNVVEAIKKAMEVTANQMREIGGNYEIVYENYVQIYLKGNTNAQRKEIVNNFLKEMKTDNGDKYMIEKLLVFVELSKRLDLFCQLDTNIPLIKLTLG